MKESRLDALPTTESLLDALPTTESCRDAPPTTIVSLLDALPIEVVRHIFGFVAFSGLQASVVCFLSAYPALRALLPVEADGTLRIVLAGGATVLYLGDEGRRIVRCDGPVDSAWLGDAHGTTFYAGAPGNERRVRAETPVCTLFFEGARDEEHVVRAYLPDLCLECCYAGARNVERLVRRCMRPRTSTNELSASVDVTTHYEGEHGEERLVRRDLMLRGRSIHQHFAGARQAERVVRLEVQLRQAPRRELSLEQQGLSVIFTAIEALGMVQDELHDRMMRQLSRGGADDWPRPRRNAVMLAMKSIFEITLGVAQHALDSV